jgi:hypothetical protein
MINCYTSTSYMMNLGVAMAMHRRSPQESFAKHAEDDLEKTFVRFPVQPRGTSQSAHEAVTTTALHRRPPPRRYACGVVASK